MSTFTKCANKPVWISEIQDGVYGIIAQRQSDHIYDVIFPDYSRHNNALDTLADAEEFILNKLADLRMNYLLRQEDAEQLNELRTNNF